MAKYVNVRVKIVREFNELERSSWGGKYLAQFGEVGNERYILMDDDDIVDGDIE